MSFRSKGAFGPTVIVSREPDRSGNFICDGTADDVQINAALTYVGGVGGGTVILEEGNYILLLVYLFHHILFSKQIMER